MDDRLAGIVEVIGSNGLRSSLAGELGSRPCQKRRGESVDVFGLNGEDAVGEGSALNRFPCLGQCRTGQCRKRRTFDCGKLGEFLRSAIGLNSESGLLVTIGSLLGEVAALPFWIRSGGTWHRQCG